MSPLLQVEGLSKRFGGLRATDGLELSVVQGEIVGLLGPNGSGKTTAMNLISGALRPDQGSIRFAGREIAGRDAFRIARMGVARTFQLVRVLPSMDCMGNVTAALAFGAEPQMGPQARVRAVSLLERVGLEDRLHAGANTLTYMDQKRLELARALALGPRLLLLDEWLAGLNPSELRQGVKLLRSLRDDGITILMVEHVMQAIRALCDRCVVMSAGRHIAEGPTAQVLREASVVAAYLGEENAEH